MNGSHEVISVTVILVLAQTLRAQSLTSFVAGLVESSHQQDKPAVTLRPKAIQNPKHICSTFIRNVHDMGRIFTMIKVGPGFYGFFFSP
jgi:hypothetical protein